MTWGSEKNTSLKLIVCMAVQLTSFKSYIHYSGRVDIISVHVIISYVLTNIILTALFSVLKLILALMYDFGLKSHAEHKIVAI